MAYDIQNRFLRAFRPDQLDRLGPIRHVELRRNEVIYAQQQPITHIIFIESGLVSCLRYVPGATTPVELCTVGGATGAIGAHTVLHTPESFFEYRMRIAGTGWRVESAAIHAAMTQDAEISAHMQRIIRASNLRIAQTAACAKAHSLEQRVCRLVLQIREALEADDIPVSRRALAQMMMISRGHMFLITKRLAGILTFRANHLLIDDALALAARACGCFEEMRVEREKLLAYR